MLIVICLEAASQTATNNLPCNAIALNVNLDGNCNYDTVTFYGDETDSGVPNPGCASYIGDDLWYSVTVPSTGAVTIETNKDSFSGPSSIDDGGMAVYTNACDDLILYECNDDGNTTLAQFEKITYIGTVGEVIYVRLWQFDTTDTAGTHRICVYAVDPPTIATNDDCASAITLNLNSTCSPIIGTNFGATNSGVAGSLCGDGLDDVWFKIVLDDTKDYDIAIETYEDDNSITDGVMAVYTENTPGDCSLGLTEIDCDDDGGVITNENFERIELLGRRNETIYVRFWSFENSETGTFNICATDMSSLTTDDILVNEFTLYPNPAQNVVNLKFNHTIQSNEIIVNLFSIQGKLVLNSKKQLVNKGTQLDITSLESGLYFLKINDGVNEQTKKLIVK